MIHWSHDFYKQAKKEGYKFAVRQHIPNFTSGIEPSLHKLNSEEEIWNLPFIQRWSKNIVIDDCVLPPDHPETFVKWERRDHYGEQLLIAHLKNKSHWVVAYLMDLEKLKEENL